jgi:hypothetical protein
MMPIVANANPFHGIHWCDGGKTAAGCEKEQHNTSHTANQAVSHQISLPTCSSEMRSSERLKFGDIQAVSIHRVHPHNCDAV